jgi:cytochrome P450
MVHRAPNTLTLIDKKAHGRRRRIISQGFGDAAMRIFEPVILSHVRKLCERMNTESSYNASSPQEKGTKQWSTSHNMARWGKYRCNIQEILDITDTSDLTANYLTFDVMSDVIFGEAFHLLEKSDNRFIVDCIEKSNVRTGVLLQAPVLATRKLDYVLFPEAIRGRNLFIGFVNKLLQQRMKVEPLKRTDIFSKLLDAVDPETKQKLNIAEIGAESTTMIVAGERSVLSFSSHHVHRTNICAVGSDTSSSAIASTFFYLAKNPEIYTRAVQEVRAVFPDVESVKLGPELNSCTFLRACIDESLRMSPPAGSAPWREIVGVGVTIDGHYFPAGVDVGTGIYSIHHNPKYFPDPFVYRPERWLATDKTDDKKGDFDEQAVQLAHSAFNPFSLGARGCIGKGLAMVELTLTLATVLRKFDFRIASEAEKIGGGTPWAAYGRHRPNEYQLYDHITAAKEGPWVQFLEAPAPVSQAGKSDVLI